MNKTSRMIKNSLIILFFLSFMTPHGSHASSAFTITEEGDVEIGGRGTKNTLKINDEVVAPIPLGGIIDWWRPNDIYNIPLNFLMCDGSVVDDSASPYNGIRLPDLRSKFTRGVVHPSDIGRLGGRDKQSYRGSVDEGGSHQHSFNDHGSRTLTISNGGDNPGRPEYSIQDEDRWGTKEHIVVAGDGYWSERSGNHRHDLPRTDEEGRHSHTFNIVEMDTVPSYVGLLKIMRIK